MRMAVWLVAGVLLVALAGCGSEETSGSGEPASGVAEQADPNVEDRLRALEEEAREARAAARRERAKARRARAKARRERRERREAAREREAAASASEAAAGELGDGGEGIVVPNVVGLDHQAAQDAMQGEGLWVLDELDCSGQDRPLLWDRNWEVVSTDPPAGTVVGPDTTITLCSVK
jgi:hypothetical protein